MNQKKWPNEVVIYTDGASRGNPGPASIGVFVTTPNGEILDRVAEVLGFQTNNYAEYSAVIRALELAIDNKVSQLHLKSDSELLIRQLSGLYKVKSETIKPLFDRCQKLISQIKSIKYEHIKREHNSEADRLANLALDDL